MSLPRFAVLLDGAFVIKRLESHLQRFPSAAEIQRLCDTIAQLDELRDLKLLRIYFYHAQPAEAVLVNPIDRTRINLASSAVYVQHKKLLQTLELIPNFALRLGEIAVNDWRLGGRAMKSLKSRMGKIEAQDLVPNISQKGVDLRIGLDIARLSLRRLADLIVVVTGDSDLVPAFRFARREGLRVYLDYLGHGVTRNLKVHCDMTIPNTLLKLSA